MDSGAAGTGATTRAGGSSSTRGKSLSCVTQYVANVPLPFDGVDGTDEGEGFSEIPIQGIYSQLHNK